MRNLITAWLALPLLVLGACASDTADWYSPKATAQQAQGTLAACRRQASALANQDFDRRTGYTDPTIGSNASSLPTRMAVYDAKVRERQLVADCMTARGFRQGKPGEPRQP